MKIQMSFVEPKEILLSLLADIITTVADENISLKFQISNPSNDTNISNFLNSDGVSALEGNLSSAEHSELNLLIPNVFEKNVGYKYRFIITSGNGNKTTHNFTISIPYLTAYPKIRLYNNSGGLSTAGETAISNMNLPQPSSPIQGFTGN